MRPCRPRLPWKRGPAAWQVATRANEILETLAASPRRFFSLRATARVFGISTQPLRDWIGRGDLNREGPRLQFSRGELHRFVKELVDRAEPYDWQPHIGRFHRHLKRPPRPFEKLRAARFVWPKGRTSLTPRELSSLIPCHSSLVVKAIKASWRLGRRRTPCRWKITRRAWSDTFFFTLITKRRWPSLPHGDLLSTAEVAEHLKACGMDGLDQLGVRKLIKDGVLEGLHRNPRGLKWFVKKASLKKFRKTLKKPLDTLF